MDAEHISPEDRVIAKFTDRPGIDLSARDWPAALDLEALAEREPELPRFIIADWLPVGYATLLAGHGGIGKSAIALHLAVCVAAGVPFFGLEVSRRRVLYLSCEDREPILHWRLSRICWNLGLDLARLRGWLEILDLVGHDSILFQPERQTGNALTAAYGALDERMRKYQTELLIADGISDLYGGNENDRGMVKRFVNHLIALIPGDTGAVLFLGHVPKLGSTSGTNSPGYSGSTGWHNSVRGRWYLYPETTQGDDGERTGDLILDLQKNNFGRTDQSMRFSWDDDAHLFIGQQIAEQSHFDRTQRDKAERESILAALKACAASVPPLVVPAAMTGPRTAYNTLSLRPEFPDSLRAGRPAKRRFWRQIESLRQMHAIEECAYRRANRHMAAQITITAEGMRQCAQ